MENSNQTRNTSIPSFFQNSCTGRGLENHREHDEEAFRDSIQSGRGDGSHPNRSPDMDVRREEAKETDWTRCLAFLPSFHSENLLQQLITKSSSWPTAFRSAPKAFRSKKHGYKLWKVGYVYNVLVKPNVQGKLLLFLVKSKVHASMKNVHYDAYVHLDQGTRDVVYAKCTCKAGEGGCCKHEAALLYTLIDYVNMEVAEVPKDLSCTQVGQKWHLLARSHHQGKHAFKFSSTIFEKAEDGKKRKRPQVGGERDGYCATPPFAQQTTKGELESMVEKLRKGGKALLFCDTLESNEFQPSSFYETSSSKAVAALAQNEDVHDSFEYLYSLYKNIPCDFECAGLLTHGANIDSVKANVDVSLEASLNICSSTMDQREDLLWYLERSKRITASVFGKIMKRRQNIMPTSIINSSIAQKDNRKLILSEL